MRGWIGRGQVGRGWIGRGRIGLTISAGLASVLVAGFLVVIKLWALGQTGALSVAASLADSAMDVMVSLAAMAALIYAAKPADDDHAFGHTSAEDLVSLGQALFILLSAGVIAVAAVKRLWASAGQPTPSATIHAEAAGIAVMTLSIVVTLGLVASQGRVARLTGSRVIAADRLHYLGDLLPNLGAIAALWASARFSIVTVDAVIALGTAGVLALGALRIARRRGMR